MATKINEWNENVLDDDNFISTITQDMSGDSVLMMYTENGFEEDTISRMLTDIGFSVQEDTDDIIDTETPGNVAIDERLNAFLADCVEVSHAYPYFVKRIDFNPANQQSQLEIRIVLPANTDFRKLPHSDANKIMFMHFLKDLREKEKKFSMSDETLWFCGKMKEFWIIIRPTAKVL